VKNSSTRRAVACAVSDESERKFLPASGRVLFLAGVRRFAEKKKGNF
jgi:hypothetical protein